MSEADAVLIEDGGIASPASVAELPVDWEFAERILRRLKPRNQQDVYDMAARQSKWGGMLITLMVVVWWLLIGLDDDNMGIGVSVFFGLDFEQAALAVMALSLLPGFCTSKTSLWQSFMACLTLIERRLLRSRPGTGVD